jgi:hypothetical protein
MSGCRLAGLFLGAALTLVASTAPATVLYEYHSFCTIDCQNIGLNPGDGVGGLIGFSDESVAAGGVFSINDVEYFDVRFGDFEFFLPSLGSAFAVFTDPVREAFSFQFVTNAAGTSPGFAFAQTNWVAGGSVFEASYGGPGSLRQLAPEPAPVALTVAALIGWCARRRVGSGTRQRSQGATASGSTP